MLLALLAMLAPPASRAAPTAQPGTVVAWGCGTVGLDADACNVPAGLSGVTAIATSLFHSLALRYDGTVVAWGCGDGYMDSAACRRG